MQRASEGVTCSPLSGGSAGVTDAGSSVACGECACEGVACLGGAAGGSGAVLVTVRIGRRLVRVLCVESDWLGVPAGSSTAACGSSAGVTDAGSGVVC